MDNLGESVLSSHYVAPMDQAQAIKLSLKGASSLMFRYNIKSFHSSMCKIRMWVGGKGTPSSHPISLVLRN